MAAKTTAKKKVQYWGTGRRKKAVARVRVLAGGSGTITINKRSIDDYFPLETLKLIVNQPFVETDTVGKFDVIVNVRGGDILVRRALFATAFPELCATWTARIAPRSKRLASSRATRA